MDPFAAITTAEARVGENEKARLIAGPHAPLRGHLERPLRQSVPQPLRSR